MASSHVVWLEEEGGKIIGGKPILSKTINISISLDRDLLEALNIASNAKNISRSVLWTYIYIRFTDFV